MRVLYAHDCLAFKLCWGGFSEEMFRHYALETVVMIHAIVAFVVDRTLSYPPLASTISRMLSDNFKI